MLHRFLAYIRDNGLFDANDHILLSVSGGIDSLVLWHLFQRAGFRYAVTHCNFHLRGAESDGDEQFIRHLTENQGVKFYVKSFETARYADRHHISIQMAARELRRAWMDDLMKEGPFRYYATAHHHSDAIETFLFKAVKGTGIAGLHGILPKIGSNIHPLLFATRQEILDYARKNKIEWRENSSNESIKYHRNLIRHEVIPMLKKINPGLEGTFDRTFKKIRAQEAFFKDSIAHVIRDITEEKAGALWINIIKLKKLAGAEAVLNEILQPLDFNFDQVLEIVQHLEVPVRQIVPFPQPCGQYRPHAFDHQSPTTSIRRNHHRWCERPNGALAGQNIQFQKKTTQGGPGKNEEKRRAAGCRATCVSAENQALAAW